MAPLLGSSATPAAQPMGRQDMLARILMGNPDPNLPSYPVMQSAEDRGFAPMPRSFADAGARMGAVLRGDVAPTPEENRQISVVRGFTEGPAAIRAFHGSPHQFDRFDMSRIGTGEGAQAYGHGLYFAGNEGVARSYRDQLSRPYYATQGGDDVAKKYGADTLEAFHNVNGDPALVGETVQRLRGLVQRNLADFDAKTIAQLKPQYDGDLASQTIKMAQQADNLEALLKSGSVKRVGEGRMYEVRLNTTPDRLLDWDAPYQRQPPNVQGAMADVFGHENLTGSLDKTIGHRFGALSYNHFGREGGDAAASSALREAGIPGIQYLDQGSRATAGGELLGVTQGPKGWQAKIRVDNRGGTVFADPTQQITTSRPFQTQADAQAWADGQINGGTRNYVMFDDKLIDILRRYGLAGMLTGGAASQAQTEE